MLQSSAETKTSGHIIGEVVKICTHVILLIGTKVLQNFTKQFPDTMLIRYTNVLNK